MCGVYHDRQRHATPSSRSLGMADTERNASISPAVSLSNNADTVGLHQLSLQIYKCYIQMRSIIRQRHSGICVRAKRQRPPPCLRMKS